MIFMRISWETVHVLDSSGGWWLIVNLYFVIILISQTDMAVDR